MVFDFSSSPNSFEVFGLQIFITQNLQLVTLGHEKQTPPKKIRNWDGGPKKNQPHKNTVGIYWVYPTVTVTNEGLKG